MSERRRLMMSEKRLLEDGLLFWFDGLNKGNTPSTKWEPYYCDTTLGNFYMNTVGSPTVNNDGYGCSAGNCLKSNDNPFIQANTEYTVIICVSNIVVEYGSGDRALMSFNKIGNNSLRGEFFLRGTGMSKSLAIWINNSNTIGSLVRANNGDSGCFALGSDSENTYFATNTSSYSYDTKSGSRKPSTQTGLFVCLANYTYYDGTMTYSQGVPGNYHAFLMYNRVLSSSEMESVTNYLNKRYGI